MALMSDFSSIVSMRAVEEASQKAQLMKTLLLPAELGGRDVPENVVFIPPHAKEIKENSTNELLSAVRQGMTEVAVFPEYRGTSFVPSKIIISAARSGMRPEYELEIRIW